MNITGNLVERRRKIYQVVLFIHVVRQDCVHQSWYVGHTQLWWTFVKHCFQTAQRIIKTIGLIKVNILIKQRNAYHQQKNHNDYLFQSDITHYLTNLTFILVNLLDDLRIKKFVDFFSGKFSLNSILLNLIFWIVWKCDLWWLFWGRICF